MHNVKTCTKLLKFISTWTLIYCLDRVLRHIGNILSMSHGHQNKDITSSYYLRLQQCFMRMCIYVICKETLKYHWKIFKTYTYLANMYICFFDWSYSSHSRIFHSIGDVTLAGEGLQILTYARHLWPLSSEGSSACHTYCDTRHLFIMVAISKDPWYSHLLSSLAVELSLPVLTTWLRCGCDSNTQHFACAKHNEICVRISMVISIWYFIVLL